VGVLLIALIAARAGKDGEGRGESELFVVFARERRSSARERKSAGARLMVAQGEESSL
jgi:hypothetical protein